MLQFGALFAASTSVPQKKKKKEACGCFLFSIISGQRLGHILTGAVSLLLKEEKKKIPPDILYPSSYCACCLVSQLVRHLHCWTL